MTKDDFYLKDIELCKALQPIMVRKGIEADGFIDERNILVAPIVTKYFRDVDGVAQKGYCAYYDDPTKDIQESWIINPCLVWTSTYRKDSLEAALPDDCWKGLPLDKLYKKYGTEQPNEIIDRAMDLLWLAIKGDARGQESLIALAQLIILLDKEGVE